MTVSIVANEHRQAAIEEVTPDAQMSTNTETAVTGSDIDARGWGKIGYTAVNDDSPANIVQWAVYGANKSDFSDEVAVQALADIAAGANAIFGAVAYYSYYRVKIHSKADGSHGSVTVRGIAKG